MEFNEEPKFYIHLLTNIREDEIGLFDCNFCPETTCNSWPFQRPLYNYRDHIGWSALFHEPVLLSGRFELKLIFASFDSTR